LHLPLIAKDAIKEALMDALGAPETVERSREIGRAAVQAMFAVANTSCGAVLESNFDRYVFPYLIALPGSVVEVRCCCSRELALLRYRDRSTERHPGHLDCDRTESELWNDELLQPLGIGPLIEIDTTAPVDIESLALQIMSIRSEAP
jgi:hypothetical protein